MMTSLGCAVAVPMHELSTPETLGPLGFRLALVTGSAPAFVTPSATTNLTTRGETVPLAGYHLDVGITQNLQANVEVLGSGVNIGTAFALKYQFMGANYFAAKAGNIASALTLRAWNSASPSFKISDVATTPTYSYGDLVAKGYDITFSYGKRFWDPFAAYIGIKAVSGDIEAKYKNAENGPIISTEARNISGAGIVAGLNLGAKSENIGFDLNLEGEAINLPSTFNNDKTWFTSFMLLLGVPFRF